MAFRKFIFINVLILVFLGSNIFALFYYIGWDATDGVPVRATHFAINFLILCNLLAYFVIKLKIPKIQPLTILFIVVCYMLVISIFLNPPFEYLPSAFRMLSYIGIAYLAYELLRSNDGAFFYKSIGVFMLCSTISILFFGYLEVVTDDFYFINGVDRSSANFKFHPLAFSMFCFVIINYLLVFKILNRKKSLNILTVIIILLLVYLFINAHSRLMTVSLFFTPLIIAFLISKNLLSKLKYLIAFSVIIAISYHVIMTQDISPRIKYMLASNRFLEDSSSQLRIQLVEESLDNLNILGKIFGEGIGGFHMFYYGISNRTGVAAHNNLLLFFVEGGIIGLTMMLIFYLFLFIILVRFLRKHRFNDIGYYTVLYSLVLFVGIEVFGFLLNNLYYYQSEILVFAFLGASFYYIKLPRDDPF